MSTLSVNEQIKRMNILEKCFNLQDGVAIMKKGVAVFHACFGEKRLLLWKSVVLHRGGLLFVPFVCINGKKLTIDWVLVDGNTEISAKSPTLLRC